MRATPSQLLGSHVAVGAATARSIGEEKSQAEAGDAEVPTRSLGGRHAGLRARGAGGDGTLGRRSQSPPRAAVAGDLAGKRREGRESEE